jgi:hypothetical protein
MIRVAILDENRKELQPKEVASAADLRDVVEQARRLIRQCETMGLPDAPQSSAPKRAQAPYLS